MEHTVTIRKIQISAQKNRLIANLIRGQKANIAIEILNLINKKSSFVFKKGLYAAISNVKNISLMYLMQMCYI